MNNELIERALGIPVQKSPVYTAKTLLRECYRDKPLVIRDTTFDLRDLPFSESAQDLVKRSELEPSMIGKTVHHFDKISAYLSACSGTNTGIGDPVHETENIVPGLPGIYRVTYTGPFLGYAPPIIEPGQEWVTNDVLLFAQSKGFEFWIHEAWTFKDYDRVLGNRVDKRNWARKIWNAMQACKGVDEEAYQYLKQVGKQGLGSFNTGQDKYPGINLIHPNWWFDVMGRLRVNMLCNIEKFGIPVLAYVDGLWYITRDTNYRTAVPGMLDKMGQLGGYKHEYSFVLTEEIYEQSRGLSIGEQVTLFNKAGAK